MAASNSNIQISNLDFDSIKNNLKTFLRGQQTFKDYDFEGSGLAVLVDLMAYNTHYNSYYLNMVANEMFMDTAALRSSVVSHAKLLNYTPHSATSPSATITLVANQVTDASLTIPTFTKFASEAIDGTNYTFFYQNYYFVAAGLRIMPFRNYRWKENEWLSKTAIFGEWIGLGRDQFLKQDGSPPNVPNYDLRFGVKFSSRRF